MAMPEEQEGKQKPQCHLRAFAELTDPSAHNSLAKASVRLYGVGENISLFLRETVKLHGEGMGRGRGK